MERKIIAPYVREARCPDFDTSVKVADQALIYFRSTERQFGSMANPAACVALALYRNELDTETRISQLAKMCGKSTDGFMRVVSETRSLLNLPFSMSFEQLTESAHLPARLASTARKVFDGLKEEFPGDDQVNRASIYAAVLLVVAIKRGFKKDVVLPELSRVTATDPDDVAKSEVMVRELMGRKYGLQRGPAVAAVRGEAGENVKAVAAKSMTELKEAPAKKKVQTRLSFPLAGCKE